MFNKDSFLLFAVVISTAVATSAAFTALQPHPGCFKNAVKFPHFYTNNSWPSDHPGKCYLPSTGRAYSVGELWPSASQCVQFECLRFRGRGGYVLGMESRQYVNLFF